MIVDKRVILTDEQNAIVREVDLRISQAEAKMLRWLILTGVGIIASIVMVSVAMGRLFQQADDTERRVISIEKEGSMPMQLGLARIIANQVNDRKAIEILILKVDMLK